MNAGPPGPAKSPDAEGLLQPPIFDRGTVFGSLRFGRRLRLLLLPCEGKASIAQFAGELFLSFYVIRGGLLETGEKLQAAIDSQVNGVTHNRSESPSISLRSL